MSAKQKSRNSEINSAEKERLEQMTLFECEARAQGFSLIAGVDEAGRGPLAGPVVAGACLFLSDFLLPGLNDSKQVPVERRRELYRILTTHPDVVWAVGIVEAETIDRINIYQATRLAMGKAIAALRQSPDFLFVDGMTLEVEGIPCRKLIRGDARSHSIAAASIIAKETRDALMIAYDAEWPVYGFKQHKGYGTEQHRNALHKHGPCPIHRRSFRPVSSL